MVIRQKTAETMNIFSKKQGFTLIELMLVVAIIGILAAIAVPNFMSYRERSYDKVANTVLKNITSAQSAYNAAYGIYTSDQTALMSMDPNIPVSTTTLVSWGIMSASATAFTASSTHAQGSGMTYDADESAVITMH